MKRDEPTQDELKEYFEDIDEAIKARQNAEIKYSYFIRNSPGE